MTYAPDATRVGKVRAEARMIMDSNGQIREANDAAHRLLDYRAGTLVGLSLAWIMPPSRHTLLRELTQALKDGARRSLPGVLMRDDSSLILVVMTTHPCAGPRGQELAVSFELDDQQAPAIQREGVDVAPATSARPTRPPAPPRRGRPGPVRERAAQVQRVDVPEQLAACMDLLRWLDGQLQHPSAPESLRDRALARIVLQEASQLIELCQGALRVEPKAK